MDRPLNIGLLAHVDAGKTTVTEQILFITGQTRTAGNVDDGTAHTDFLQVERSRGISVRSAVVNFTYLNRSINIIDTPGHADFAAEVERSLSVLDVAVLIISAAEGIQAQTEILYRALCATKTKIIIFINKVDRPGVGSAAVMNAVQNEFGAILLPLSSVTNEGEKSAVVDSFSLGSKVWIERMSDRLVDLDDILAEKYINEESITENDVCDSISRCINENNVIPVFCGSAIGGIGVREMLDFAAEYVSPANNSESDTLSGVVFKIQADKSMGKTAFVRLFSGSLNNRDSVIIRDEESKITQIRRPYADRLIDIGSMHAGDVCAVCGISNARVGDILGEKSSHLMGYELSVPLLRVRVIHSPDIPIQNVLKAFRELTEEDPKLDTVYNEDEKEIDISITGVIQLEILSAIVRERYGFEVTFSSPTVIYKETPSSHGFGFDAYTMPKPCWAVIKFEIEPMPRGSGLEYSSIVPNGKILYRYQHHIEQCLPDALKQGLYNWEVTDLKITLVDGGSHHIHTHPLDFFLCTPLALINGLQNTGTTLLEPYNSLRIVAPEDFSGRIIGDIIAMRGRFDSPVIQGGNVSIEAQVPVSDSMDYSVRLATMTGGKAFMSSRFLQYEPCPEGIGQATKRRGVDPRDRAKWILYHRNAMRDTLD